LYIFLYWSKQNRITLQLLTSSLFFDATGKHVCKQKQTHRTMLITTGSLVAFTNIKHNTGSLFIIVLSPMLNANILA